MTGAIAILCSGQGGQHPDMFALTGGAPEAEPIFAAASSLLGGVDPRRLVRDLPADELFGNRVGQILCCTQALASVAALGDVLDRPLVIAGYSVGELAAWGCAGRLGPEAVLRLASVRAEAMDRASPAGAGLAAVAGLDRSVLESLLGAHGVSLAIDNGPDSIVAGGPGEALDAFLASARARAAPTAARLRVAVPSHTALLAPAARAFGSILEREPESPGRQGTRLLSGIDADRVRDGRAGLRKLAAQVGQTVEWHSCLVACAEAGAVRWLELGPGEALARMARRLADGAAVRALEDFRTIDGVKAWL